MSEYVCGCLGSYSDRSLCPDCPHPAHVAICEVPMHPMASRRRPTAHDREEAEKTDDQIADDFKLDRPRNDWQRGYVHGFKDGWHDPRRARYLSTDTGEGLRDDEALMALFRENGWALAISDGEPFDPWQRVAFKLLAAALSTGAPGLDVKRLARALGNLTERLGADWLRGPLNEIAGLTAAEYARLASPGEP